MRKTLVTLVAGACLAVPAGVLADDAPNTTPNASQSCKQLRETMGEKTFKATYGTNANKSNAFGKCVSKASKAQQDDQSSAAEQCKAEQTADAAAFATKYGTNNNDENAYGKCVSAKSKKADEKRTDATVNAAKQCKAERKADPAAFKAKYATNKDKANAFGKCVSTKAKAQQDEATTPPAS
ncbi:MAG: hypothetical protein ACR2ML_04795 [Solirubrobacteraceae bacterium]